MYHINSSSPFYQLNTADNNARRSYYGINSTPSSKCDGILSVYPTTSNLQNAYNQRNAVDAPVDINLDITIDEMINVHAEITAESYFTGSNLFFRTAIIAYELNLSGLTYKYVLLEYAPGTTGQAFSIAPSGTVTLDAEFDIPTVTGLENVAVVAFVQNDGTKEVLQAKEMAVPINFPNLSLTEFGVTDDTPGGNGNGIPEAGETCQAWIELFNNPIFANARGVTAILSTGDPLITITDAEATFGDIGSGASANNQDNPFEFEIDPSLEAHIVTFQVDITANSGNYTTTQYFEYMIGLPHYLLVDDDGNQNSEVSYISAFGAIDEAYTLWEVNSLGAPSGEYLANFATVIWTTGAYSSTLDEAEQTALAEYLDGGGSLFMSSQNLGDNIGSTAFYTDYMHAAPLSNHIAGFLLEGVEGDPITDGMELILAGGAYTPNSQSSIIPDAEAYPIFYYTSPSVECGGLRYSGDDYALAYLAFPWECTSNSAVGYTHRDDLFEAILTWLDNPLSAFPGPPRMDYQPENYEIASISPNPFNPQTAIRLNIPQTGKIEAAVYNLLGEKAAVLYSGEIQAGSHNLLFDASDLASGIYLLKVDTPEGVISQKMILMK